MLSDPDSKIIRAYGVLNPEARGIYKGMARPGFFFIDTQGKIREKFFEVKYRERLTGGGLVSKLFPELGEEVTDQVEAPHLRVALEQSDRAGVPGNWITLTARVELPRGVHVYAPGVLGYKPIQLVIDALPEFVLGPASYPAARILYLPAIKERVPVFEGAFRIRQDLRINTSAEFSNSLGAEGKVFSVTGKLEYQACDKKICYLPASVPLRWQLQVLPLDRQRAPENIRHK